MFGEGSTDDNIYVRRDASGNLYFGWGRNGSINECKIGYVASNVWYGLYVGHNGRRMNSGDATAANLADAFDIRLMFQTDSFTNAYQKSSSTTWTNGSTGGRMDRGVTGDFTIGGRGSNRNFHGKVASFVSTTLRRGVNMPSEAEIKLMITDPTKWVDDYKIGNLYRASSGNYNNSNFQKNDIGAASATQVWLMGDGTNDSFSLSLIHI